MTSTETNSSIAFICPRCNATAQSGVNFCSQCGYSFVKARSSSVPSPKNFFLVVLASLGLFLFGWNTQKALAGKRPTQHFEGQQISHQAGLNDPEVLAMRKAAEAKPKDIEGWSALAGVLLGRVREATPPVDAALIFETIDVLRKILDIEPQNSSALIAMADLSFEQQAFEKALQFYEKYLAIEGGDLNARARYASALTFIGRTDQALSELAKITEKDPKHFQATAYSAIALAQLGKYDEAKKVGENAIKLAPSEEARARFSDFLVKIGEARKEKPASAPSQIETKLPPDANAIVEYIKTNPIAGPKFVTGFMKGQDTLVLQFKDFPMDKMPPFVKDKFINGIKGAVEGTRGKLVTTIRFEDATSGAELYSTKL